MPKLDLRLKTVAQQIRCKVHADIGSDHGHLLVALIKSGRIEHGIAIENKPQPFENSRRALFDVSSDVRFGDGLEKLETGEADSLSICGMGAESMAKILEAYPARVPPKIVLQPNRQPEIVRRWALSSGFRLIDEQVAYGHWPYEVMTFTADISGEDPAYENVDLRAAMLFGPLIIKRRDQSFKVRLKEEERYLSSLDSLGPESAERFETVRQLLSEW